MPKTNVKTSTGQDISVFNTRRGYTVHGQRIAYCLHTSGNIAMYDIDRQIWYSLIRPTTYEYVDGHDEPVEVPEQLTDALVLRQYDNNQTTPYVAGVSSKDSSELLMLSRELGKAAAELAPSLQNKG